MHLGVDLGGTKIEVAALDPGNRFLYSERIASPRDDYQNTLSAIVALVARAEESLGTKCTIGIGIPGSISPATGLIQNANSTWLIGRPLKKDLEALFQRPVAIANDANCFALSESRDGAAAAFPSVFGVILGTGVGGGFVINNTAHIGPNAIGGEWGHNPMPLKYCQNEQPLCYCGKTHCIETYLSGPSLVRDFNHRYASSYQSVEQILAEATPDQQLFTLERYTVRLAAALGTVINTLDPDCIVLGGGLSNIQSLYDELPEAIQQHVFTENFATPILKAKFGDASGVRGAAWLGAAIP